LYLIAGRFQNVARLKPSPTQLVEVAKAVELKPAHAWILARVLPLRQYHD
jgi:hypothetical protein